jgi:hypothetical protein
VIGIAFEGQHHIDHMLEQLRPGQRAVLSHMANQDSRNLALLGESDEPRRAFPNLGRATRPPIALARGNGLNGIDDQQVGAHFVRRRQDPIEVVIGEQKNMIV